jgi:ATP-dependent DNA helicase RecQ
LEMARAAATKLPRARPSQIPDTTSAVSVLAEGPSDLYTQLRALRKKLADERGVPAYVIFSDRTLQDMALKRPTTAQALLNVHGVGGTKLVQYGDAFLQLIARAEPSD